MGQPKTYSSTLYVVNNFVFSFITVIGIFDTLFVLSQFITLGLVELVNKYEFTASIHLTSPFMVPIKGFAYISSVYLTILLTVERYIVICHQAQYIH